MGEINPINPPFKYVTEWRSKGNWRPGANLHFASPSKKFLKNDNKMSSSQLIMCIIILA